MWLVILKRSKSKIDKYYRKDGDVAKELYASLKELYPKAISLTIEKVERYE